MPPAERLPVTEARLVRFLTAVPDTVRLPAMPPMPSAFDAVSAARTLASAPSTLSSSREPRL